MTDSYTRYETGVRALLARLGRDHPRSADALVYQQRLHDNLTAARRYGDTETRRAERAEIIDRLNALAQAALGVSFNALCGEGEAPSEAPPVSPSPTSTQAVGPTSGATSPSRAATSWAAISTHPLRLTQPQSHRSSTHRSLSGPIRRNRCPRMPHPPRPRYSAAAGSMRRSPAAALRRHRAAARLPAEPRSHRPHRAGLDQHRARVHRHPHPQERSPARRHQPAQTGR